MYYIISKAADEAGRRAILSTIDSRDAARAYARDNAGTVKTEAELEELRAAGKLAEPLEGDRPGDPADPYAGQAAMPGRPQPDAVVGGPGIPTGTEMTNDAKAPAAGTAWDGNERRAETDPVDPAAVVAVVQHAAQVAAEAAALLGPAKGKGASIMAMAHEIKTNKPARKTIGKHEKAGPKRPATDDGTLALAREHLLAIARPEAKLSKVQIVRDLATWGDKKLQRKDVFALIKSYPNDLGIADATISTQFQFARSGKDRQHA